MTISRNSKYGAWGAALRRFVIAAVAVLFLNSALTFDNLWPTPWVAPTRLISIEVVLVVLALALLGRELSRRRALRAGLAFGIMVLALARYGEVTAAGLFGRELDLYWDLRHGPAVLLLIAGAAPVWVVAGFAVVAGLAGFGLVLWLFWLALGAVSAALAGSRHGRIAGGLSMVLLLLLGLVDKDLFARPAAAAAARQLALVGKNMTAGTEALPSALIPGDFGALAGADVFVLFFESYGAEVFEYGPYEEATRPAYAQLADVLEGAGWQVASGLVDSPTFGGASWLSHATLLAGQWIDGPLRYRDYLSAPPETLTDRFNDAGYRTIALMPNLQSPWPEGEKLRFDRLYGAASIGYSGPSFGRWRIPDQASLAWLGKAEIDVADRAPLFVFYPMITNHFPYTPVPPYLRDWSKFQRAEPYGAEDKPAEPETYVEGYLGAVRYTLAVLGGFLSGVAPRDAVVVVLGDHQPPTVVSRQGASNMVPVHIFSTNPARLRVFEAEGFAMGLVPSRLALTMAELSAVLVRAFSQPGR